MSCSGFLTVMGIFVKGSCACVLTKQFSMSTNVYKPTSEAVDHFN